MRPLSLLCLLLISQLAAGLYASTAPSHGHIHSGVSKGVAPAVHRGLSAQGAVQEAHTAEPAATGLSQRHLQQSGSAAGRVVGWGVIKIPNYVPEALQQGAIDVAIIPGDSGLEDRYLALLTNQSVIMWGGTSGEVGIPPNTVANVTAIAANMQAALVYLSNGSVVKVEFYSSDPNYDYNSDDPTLGMPMPKAVQANVDAIWAGADWFFARLRNGSFVSWKWDKSTADIAQPTSGSGYVVSVAAGQCGGRHSCWMTLRANGSVIPQSGVSVVPEVLQSNVRAIAGSNVEATSFLALLSNGSIVQWSYLSPHQLGAVLFPLNATGRAFASIAPTTLKSAWAVTADCAVVGWDLSSLRDTSKSVPVGIQNGVRSVVGGAHMSLALKQPGPYSVVGFHGEAIGRVNESIPAGVGMPVVTQVAAGRAHAIALQVDGRIAVWGDPSKGQLLIPRTLAAARVHQVAAATDYCAAVTTEGNLYVLGSYNTSAIPKAARSNVAKVAAGGRCMLAILNNGSVVAWGDPASSNVLSVPAAARANVLDIAVDPYAYHGCNAAVAVLTNGRVVQWGTNTTGPQLKNAVSVSMSSSWAAAVLKNGSVVIWPTANNTVPSPYPQDFASNLHVQSVALGDLVPFQTVGVDPSCLLLLSNGTLVPVSHNEPGEAIPPGATSGVIGMAIGGSSYFVVTTSNISSTATGATPDAMPSASISFMLTMSITSQVAANSSLQAQLDQQLQAALATFFNVPSTGVNITSDPSAARLQHAIATVSKLLQDPVPQEAQLTVLVNITATWQAGDTTTPGFLQQQVSQLQQHPATALPAALILMLYGIDAQNVTISELSMSGFAQATPGTSTPPPSVLTPGPAQPSPGAPASPPSSKKISKGAVAGIALGCTVAMAALAALSVVMYRRYKGASAHSMQVAAPHACDGVVVPGDNMKIVGLSQGELFVLATAQNYTWTETTVLEEPLQAVESGVNDTELDKMLQEGASSQQQATASLPCPAVQLSKDDLRQQVQLLSDGLLGRGSTALVFKCVWPSRFGPNALLAAKVLQNGFESDMSVLSSFAYEANLLSGIQWHKWQNFMQGPA